MGGGGRSNAPPPAGGGKSRGPAGRGLRWGLEMDFSYTFIKNVVPNF